MEPTMVMVSPLSQLSNSTVAMPQAKTSINW
jgi:hypothetical protein